MTIVKDNKVRNCVLAADPAAASNGSTQICRVIYLKNHPKSMVLCRNFRCISVFTAEVLSWFDIETHRL